MGWAPDVATKDQDGSEAWHPRLRGCCGAPDAAVSMLAGVVIAAANAARRAGPKLALLKKQHV